MKERTERILRPSTSSGERWWCVGQIMSLDGSLTHEDTRGNRASAGDGLARERRGMPRDGLGRVLVH